MKRRPSPRPARRRTAAPHARALCVVVEGQRWRVVIDRAQVVGVSSAVLRAYTFPPPRLHSCEYTGRPA